MISKKKKVFTEIETDFSAKIGNSNAFSGRITTCTSQLRTLFPLGGGLFSIFHQKSASKAPNTCDFAYFTSQWRGGLSPPPPPPPLATLLSTLVPTFRCSNNSCGNQENSLFTGFVLFCMTFHGCDQNNFTALNFSVARIACF